MAITPVDTSIQAQVPTTSATLADIMKSQNLASEIQSRTEQDKLARQQQQQNQMAMEQQQRDQADQQKLSEHFADPTNASRLASGDMSSLYKIGIQPKNVLTLQDHFIKAHKEAALAKAEDLKNEIALGDAAAQGIEGLKTIPDLNDRRAQLPGMLARWRQLGIQPPPGLDLNALDVSDAGLQKLAVQAGVGKGVAAAALKIQQDQAALGKTTAETGKLGAETDKATAETGKIQTEIPKLEADAAIRAQQAANTQNGLLPEEQQRAADAAATLAETTRRNDQTAKHETAEEAIHRINANIAGAHLALAQKTYDQTYGPNSDQQLVGVDPKARTAARAAMNEETKRYQAAIRSAEDLQTVIDLTKSGNKAAGSNLPLVSVGALNAINGIKRMNRAEIEQQAGAGSLYDQVIGKWDKLTVGQPIPPDVLKDTETLFQKISSNTDRGHAERIQGINHTFNSAFTPLKVDRPAVATPLPPKLSSSDVGKTFTNKSGQTIKITAVNPNDPTQFKSEAVK